ncbi:MAG TPA: hypothetical protein VJM50_05355 [Pyrinomonadaceae bacterium]|nr:hypothetical protein [Pyrinomonadaceae bacterium]
MRWFLVTILLLLTVTLTSCSYSTDFVVFNDTDNQIEVVYRVKPSPTGPPSLEIEPMVVSAANLEVRDISKWTKLTPDRFRIDQVNRTVTVRVAAQEGLWITSMHHYIGDEDPNDVKGFPIQEVSVTGADGEMRFTGDKARKAFERKSRVLYVLSYR